MDTSNYIKNISCIGLGIIIPIIGAEFALRAIHYERPAFFAYDNDRGFGLRPGVKGYWTQEGKGWVEINQSGYRDKQIESIPNESTLKIAVIGDSFTESLQVNDSESWPRLVENQINTSPHCKITKKYPNGVEIINLGTSATGTGLQLIAWKRDGIILKPNIVLLMMFLGNDIHDNLPVEKYDRAVIKLDQKGNIFIDNSFRKNLRSKLSQSSVGKILDFLIMNSRVFQLANEGKNLLARYLENSHKTSNIESEQNINYDLGLYTNSSSLSPGWVMTNHILKEFKSLVGSTGARLVLASTSTPEQVWPDRDWRNRQTIYKNFDWNKPEKKLKTIANSLKLPYLPLTPPLRDHVDKYQNYLHGFKSPLLGQGHWNLLGHKLAANNIKSWLCNMEYLP